MTPRSGYLCHLQLFLAAVLLQWTAGHALTNSRPQTTGGGGVGSGGADFSGHPNWSLLRNDACGANTGDGEEAKLNEHPWLAHLQYQTKNGTRYLCSGVLISNRYVLTAAHCVPPYGSNRRLVGVRLGEHNTETDPDCKDDEGDRICRDSPLDFKLAEVIPHPDFSSESRERHHDIALLRLDRDAPITDYIIPICLPDGATINKSYESETLTVAGWGLPENRNSNFVKQWFQVPVMANSECRPIYQSQITLGASQMCAGGELVKESCREDNGSPLMTIDTVPGRTGGQWVVAGVFSIGPRTCAKAWRPAIYTRVGFYMQWILDTMKA